MSKEQTALERIKDEVAKEKGYDNWRHMEINWPTVVTDNIWPEVCERFASECCQANQKKIADNARVRVEDTGLDSYTSDFIYIPGTEHGKVRVDKSSITNKDNIVIL